MFALLLDWMIIACFLYLCVSCLYLISLSFPFVPFDFAFLHYTLIFFICSQNDTISSTHSLFQGLGLSLSGRDCCYIVVFRYGSIVMFNFSSTDGWVLKIVANLTQLGAQPKQPQLVFALWKTSTT